jgi:hypothetical protein
MANFKTYFILVLIFTSTLLSARVTKNDVLSVENGKFMLDGKPFVEISFNKFDLFWSLWQEAMAGKELNDYNPMVQRQQKALSDLSKAGFKTIRFFGMVHESQFKWFKSVYIDDVKSEKIYYQALDKAIELLERNNLRAVFSLGCSYFTDEEAGEHLRELVTNPKSVSRKLLNDNIDDIVARYKNSKAILMWEVTNEMTLFWDVQPGTLEQNGKRRPTMDASIQFYKDVIARIKKKDPIRMVNSGGSMLRESAYNLNVNKKWTKDTYPQQLEMYRKMHEGTFNLIDIHYYTSSNPGYFMRDEITGKDAVLDLPVYMKIADALKLPLYVGEYGALPKPKKDNVFWGDGREWFLTFGKDEPDALKFVQRAADMAVESGVTFMHWWCYQSDRAMDQKDPLRMDFDIERTPKLFQIVVDANKRLKGKYGSLNH